MNMALRVDDNNGTMGVRVVGTLEFKIGLTTTIEKFNAEIGEHHFLFLFTAVLLVCTKDTDCRERL